MAGTSLESSPARQAHYSGGEAVAHLNPRPEFHMAPTSRIRNAKRVAGSSSRSARSEATRRSVLPPTPAPDTPDPLRELQPEADPGTQTDGKALARRQREVPKKGGSK
jgi:hypothetical protein